MVAAHDQMIPPQSEELIPHPTTKITTAKPPAAFITEAIKTEMYTTVVRKYIVSEATLDEMISGYNSIFSVFFGILTGVAGVLWGFFYECNIQPTKMYYAQFAAIASVLAVICGTLYIINFCRAAGKKKKLKGEVKLIHSTDTTQPPQ